MLCDMTDNTDVRQGQKWALPLEVDSKVIHKPRVARSLQGQKVHKIAQADSVSCQRMPQKAKACLLASGLVGLQVFLLVGPGCGVLDQALAQLVCCISQLLDLSSALQLLLTLQPSQRLHHHF